MFYFQKSQKIYYRKNKNFNTFFRNIGSVLASGNRLKNKSNLPPEIKLQGIPFHPIRLANIKRGKMEY